MKLADFYEDPSILHVNTTDNRAYYIPYETPEGAMEKPREESGRFTLLSGMWTFCFFDSIYELPAEFWESPVFEGKDIPVPSVWQNHGYDRHQYTNTRFPFPFDPPYVPAKNSCGVYRRKFYLDDSQERFYLNFEGVDSCFYVWINGVFTGYSQVSHSTSEFDVTDYVHSGVNDIAVLVLKWCDGSYLEDQDKLRMSGIFRDVYLLRRPSCHLRDFFVRTEFCLLYTSFVTR